MRKARIILLLIATMFLAGQGRWAQAAVPWQVEINPIIGSIGDTVTLTVSVHTGAGVPINNAKVVFSAEGAKAFYTVQDAQAKWQDPTSSVTIDSGFSHVNGGIYQQSVKLNQAGPVSIQVLTQDDVCMNETSAYVVGQQGYRVQVMPSSRLAPVSYHALGIAVHDELGKDVLDVDELRITAPGINMIIRTPQPTDFDGDGSPNGYLVSVNPAHIGEITIAAALGAKSYSDFTVYVLPPVVVSPVGSLTDFGAESLVMEGARLDADGKARPFLYRAKSESSRFTVGGSQLLTPTHQVTEWLIRHELGLTCQVTAGATSPKVWVEASFDGGQWVTVAELTVGAMTIELDKQVLVLGVTNWVSTRILNARGKPHAMAEVRLLNARGITDSSGEAALLVTPDKVGSYPVRVITGTSSYIGQNVSVVDSAPEDTRVVLSLGAAAPALGLDQPPVIVSGRMLLPFRWFGESILGASVDYYMEHGREVVTLAKQGVTVLLYIGDKYVDVNGQRVMLDAAPVVSGGRTLVPARFLAETFGYTVTWLSDTNEVVIEQR